MRVAATLITVCAALVACTPPAPKPRPSIQQIPTARASAEEPAVSATGHVRRVPWDRYPTEKNAGATACRVGTPTELGPLASGQPTVVFGAAGGLAVYFHAQHELALRAIGRDAIPTGPEDIFAIDAGLSLRGAYAVGEGFVVLLAAWNCNVSHTRWWAIAVANDGRARARAPTALDLDEREVSAAQEVTEGRLAIVGAPASCAKRVSDGRWLELLLASDGTITQSASDFPLHDDPSRDSFLAPSNLVPAEREGRLGWAIRSRDGALGPEGLWEGKRTTASGAKQLRPDDAIDASVGPLFDAPPGGGRSAGGRILEPVHVAALRRTSRRGPIGGPIELSGVPGSPVSWFLPSEVAWSGTEFIYAFGNRSEPSLAMLLSIACGP